MHQISELTAKALIGRQAPRAQRYALGTHATITNYRNRWYIDHPETLLTLAMGSRVAPLHRQGARQ